MKISTIITPIDGEHMALPEFQRGYVWNRDQVRGLFDSLYKRHADGGGDFQERCRRSAPIQAAWTKSNSSLAVVASAG